MFPGLLDILFPPRESECLVRLLGDAGVERLLAPQTRRFGNTDVVTLLSYDEPVVRACIVEAKYHGNARAVAALGSALAAYLREVLADREAYERRRYVLVPVPLSSGRMRERGYNQVERVARHAAECVPDMTVETGCVMRVRDTLPQTTLGGRARRMNVRGAFGAAHPADPLTTYILLDDVITTGATLADAAGALQQAGAREILPIALAG